MLTFLTKNDVPHTECEEQVVKQIRWCWKAADISRSHGEDTIADELEEAGNIVADQFMVRLACSFVLKCEAYIDD